MFIYRHKMLSAACCGVEWTHVAAIILITGGQRAGCGTVTPRTRAILLEACLSTYADCGITRPVGRETELNTNDMCSVVSVPVSVEPSGLV
jgi:hypothetical protein